MPMPYEGFNWRPNDNSAKTNLRYSLEAEKWVSAVSSAQKRAQPRSFSKDLAFVGMFVQLVFCIVLLALLGILQLIKSLVYLIESGIAKSGGSFIEQSSGVKGVCKAKSTNAPIAERKPSSRKYKISSILRYIFYNESGRLRLFWDFLYLLVFIFTIEVVGLLAFDHYFPDFIKFNQDTLIIAGVIGFWYALNGMGEP